MKMIALLVVLIISTQGSWDLPVTIETQENVEVSHNSLPFESRGRLYLDDLNTQPFRLRKGQRFQMIKIGTEGGCRIKVKENEYNLTAVPISRELNFR